jgi:myosin heavy subunit
VHICLDVSGFIVKNNFSLQEDLVELMNTTTDDFIETIIKNSPETVDSSVTKSPVITKKTIGRKRAGAVSLSSQFREQVDLLMTSLRSTQPHYIKVFILSSYKYKINRYLYA